MHTFNGNKTFGPLSYGCVFLFSIYSLKKHETIGTLNFSQYNLNTITENLVKSKNEIAISQDYIWFFHIFTYSAKYKK